MDDSCEHRFFSHGLNWSPYTYVSCWTESDEENIPLWHMYSKGGMGVRITLDKECIDWDKQIKNGYIYSEQRKRPPRDAHHSGMLIQGFKPFTIYGDITTSKCYHSINYIKESPDSNITIGYNQILVNKYLTKSEFEKYVGLYKDDKWSFQKETRFRLFAVPEIINDMTFEGLTKIITNETPNIITHFDVPLKESALNNLIITPGPNSSESTSILINLLIKEYAPSAKLERSILNSNHRHYQYGN